MILTDREIKVSIASKTIGIEPSPKSDAYSSTSVDLSLDQSIRLFKKPTIGLNQAIDPGAPGYSFGSVVGNLAEDFKIDKNTGYRLDPNVLILGWTKEKVHLKDISRVAARVEGKSSLARIGLAVHVTAPTIHSGFSGNIQLEIINYGHYPIILRDGMYICQLIFEQTLGFAEKAYQGQFSGQSA